MADVTAHHLGRGAFKVRKARLDYELGELLVEVKRAGDSTIYDSLLAKHGLSPSSAATLMDCYKVYQKAKDLLSPEDLTAFDIIGSSTKALINRLPTYRVDPAIAALASGELTNSSLKSLVRCDKVVAERTIEDLISAQGKLEAAEVAFETLKNSGEYRSDSPAYMGANNTYNNLKAVVRTLAEKLDKLNNSDGN